jgi:hypothetical protein
MTTPCPQCGRIIGVPTDKAGHATCPHCLRIFDWAPPRAEIVEFAMRCAVTGKKYVAAFTRERAIDQVDQWTAEAPQARAATLLYTMNSLAAAFGGSKSLVQSFFSTAQPVLKKRLQLINSGRGASTIWPA